MKGPLTLYKLINLRPLVQVTSDDVNVIKAGVKSSVVLFLFN